LEFCHRSSRPRHIFETISGHGDQTWTVRLQSFVPQYGIGKAAQNAKPRSQQTRKPTAEANFNSRPAAAAAGALLARHMFRLCFPGGLTAMNSYRRRMTSTSPMGLGPDFPPVRPSHFVRRADGLNDLLLFLNRQPLVPQSGKSSLHEPRFKHHPGARPIAIEL
jgi:hypothetical protein